MAFKKNLYLAVTKYIASVNIGMDLQSEDVSVFENIKNMITKSLTDGVQALAIKGPISIDITSLAKASIDDQPT